MRPFPRLFPAYVVALSLAYGVALDAEAQSALERARERGAADAERFLDRLREGAKDVAEEVDSVAGEVSEAAEDGEARAGGQPSETTDSGAARAETSPSTASASAAGAPSAEADLLAPNAQSGRFEFEGVHLGMTGSELTAALGALGYAPTRRSSAQQSFMKNESAPGGRRITVDYTTVRTEDGFGIPEEQQPAERFQLSVQSDYPMAAISERDQELERFFNELVSQYGEPGACRQVGRPGRAGEQCVWISNAGRHTETLIWSGGLSLELTSVRPLSGGARETIRQAAASLDGGR